MKFTEFKSGMENGERFSVYLFEGEDAFFRERGLTLLKTKLVSEPEINVSWLGSDFSVNELISSLEGFPFLSEYRMSIVSEFYPKQEFFKNGLKSYLENPSPNSILVIVNEKPCESLKKYDNVAVVDCSKADTSLIVKWIRGECLMSDVGIDGETAKLISEYCLSDMTRIQTETAKLISYVGGGNQITSKDVEQMVARDTEYKIYELTDYIAKRKFDSALNVINDMLSKGETAQRLLVAIYNYYRRLLHSAISGKTTAELAQAFGVKEFAARKTVEQAKLFKKKALKSAVDKLTQADYLIKSGKADADERMWITVFGIMTEN